MSSYAEHLNAKAKCKHKESAVRLELYLNLWKFCRPLQHMVVVVDGVTNSTPPISLDLISL
jgi:hypothetical protein